MSKTNYEMIPVKFVSQLTKRDWINIYLYFFVRNKKTWIFILLLLLIVNTIFIFFTRDFFLPSIAYAIVGLCIGITYNLTKVLRLISKNKRGLEKINWEINQEFIEGIGNSIAIKISLDKIFKVAETKKYFLIYKDKLEAVQIPKAQISNADLKTIRILLGRKVN